MNLLYAFHRDQNGATALQYALIAGVLSVAVLAGSLMLRGEIIALYEGMGEQANQALSADE
ncbi:MAG: Flp family type IVb pilin [Geminicoccaceae bacterium]